MPSPLSEDAIKLAVWVESCGWKPTPLHTVAPDGKTCTCPKGGNCGGSAGKHNIARGWQDDHRGADIFREMAPRRKRMNVGILTGDVSGIFVLDIDPKDGGFESMRALVAEHGPLPDTFIVKTGSGGFHYYFTMPPFDVRNSAKKLSAGIDVRGNGGMVVGPGSVSHAGPYEVLNNVAPLAAPDWLLELVKPKVVDLGSVITPDSVDLSSVRIGQTTTERAGESPAHVGAATSGPMTPESAPSLGAAPASGGGQTRQQAAYEASALSGELGRLAGLELAGWTQPWDTTTFEVACTLIELANSDWTKLTLDWAHESFIARCPQPEPGYDPEAKWISALSRVGDKARDAPPPRALGSDMEDMFGPAQVAQHSTASPGAPCPPVGAGADREGAPSPSRTHGPFAWTDSGNADRLIHWRGGVVRYAIDAGGWLTYADGAWTEMGDEVPIEGHVKRALALAKEFEWSLYSDLPQDVEAKNPKSDRDEFMKWMSSSEAYPRISAASKVARSDSRLRVELADFDKDPMVFNAANMVVNLATGETALHDPALMFRRRSDVNYDAAANCPLWDAFLAEVQPDPEVRSWLQQVLGYSMTGRMDEQAMFLHAGPGATGKSTFLEVVAGVLGSYGQKLERDTLTSKGSTTGVIPADLARMAGARFLAASETAAGKKLDDERIKELVGGDTVTARHLYGNPFQFRPSGKIHLATNHLPSFESGGDGMGRRLRLVPWEVQIPKERRDKTLKERILATEAEGVLAWLVRGAVAWSQSTGLKDPALVARRSEEHVEDADPLWTFINERLDLADPEQSSEFQQVYYAYSSWCESNGNRPMSGRALSLGLQERLGADAKFKHPSSRRSMFRARVRLQAVPEHHEQYAHGM